MNARAVAASCLLSAILTVIGPAHAFNLSFLKDGPMSKFNDEDTKLMMDAAQSVLVDAQTPVLRKWTNPSTKHSGSAESLLAFAGPNGIACKRLRISNSAEGLHSKATYTACNMGADGWQLVSSDFAPLPKTHTKNSSSIDPNK